MTRKAFTEDFKAKVALVAVLILVNYLTHFLRIDTLLGRLAVIPHNSP